MKSVHCSDWGRGWGYGGNDKIGKLSLNEDGSYTWTGHSQGRHGRKWGYCSTTFIVSEDGSINRTAGGSLPDFRDVREAIRVLNIAVVPKKQRTPKQVIPNLQTALF